MKYTRLMRARIEGNENNVPYHFEDKTNLKQFGDAIGVPVPRIYKTWNTANSIDLFEMPESFVLKPAYASTSEGVMLLARTDRGFFDHMTKKYYEEEQVIAYQTSIFEKYSHLAERVTLAEQWVRDTDALSIPLDWKFLAFQGEIGMVIRIDRNGPRLKLSYYDQSFVPVVDERIKFNESIAERENLLPPVGWESLLNLAKRISVAVPTPCARIDLYNDVSSGPILGEITLTPGSFYYAAGHTLRDAENRKLGSMWLDAAKRLGVEPPSVNPA